MMKETTMRSQLDNNLHSIQVLLDEQRRLEEQCNAIMRHRRPPSANVCTLPNVGEDEDTLVPATGQYDPISYIQELLKIQRRLEDQCLSAATMKSATTAAALEGFETKVRC